MKKHIPNFITLLNLCSGALSILLTFNGNLKLAGGLIVLAAIFDFFDGFAARLLKVKSPIGKELDSLADMVSFGLAPGFIMYMMLSNHDPLPQFQWNAIHLFPLISLLIPAMSALRLAKFNIDKRQETVFFGLPTPANALLIASLPFILSQHFWLFGTLPPEIGKVFLDRISLTAMTLIFSVLLVSEIKLISLKFSSFQWKDNQSRILLILISALLILILQYLAIPMIMVLYIFLSLLTYQPWKRVDNRQV